MTSEPVVGSLRRWSSATAGGPSRPLTSSGGSFPTPSSTTATGPRCGRPRPLAVQPRVQRAATAPSSTGCGFETPSQTGARNGRCWLQLDGHLLRGDVWLDKSYLGVTEGYFFPHIFEVTEAMAERREHLLAIEVDLHPGRPIPAAKRNLTGIFEHCDYIDRDWNPGGIWRPVRLLQSGPVRIGAPAGPTARRPPPSGPTVDLRAGLDAARAATVTLVTTLTRAGRPPRRRVATANDPSPPEPTRSTGMSRSTARSCGGRLRSATSPSTTSPSASRSTASSATGAQVRTGLRQIRMRNFVASVNGERLFLKGANQGPTRRALAEACAGDFEADVILARRAGLDLLRIHGHISRPELYEAADRHGLLLWQDLPLQWGYARVRRQAMRQAAEAVDLLGHHPSIAVWCAHNEPVATSGPGDDETASSAAQQLGSASRRARPCRRSTRPGLDRSVRRTLEKADASRPVIAHSGVFPHPAWGTDTHLYLGWQYGNERTCRPCWLAYPCSGGSSPSSAPRPSPSPPTSASRSGGPTWTGRTWPAPTPCKRARSTSTSRPPPTPASRRGGRPRSATRRNWCASTSRPCAGSNTGRPVASASSCFADSQPAVSCAVLDDERVPKAAFEALAAACAPVIVVADRLAPSYAAGTEPRHQRARGERPAGRPRRATGYRPGSAGRAAHRQWTFGGDVGADSCIRVGGLRHVLPADTRTGPAPARPRSRVARRPDPQHLREPRVECHRPALKGPNRRRSAPSPYCRADTSW